MARLELFKDNSLWKYGFSLAAHEVTLKFIASSKEEASRWYTKLKRYGEVVLLRISKEYNIGPEFGKKSYVQLQIAASLENKNKFAIKTISKEYLLENTRKLVSWINNIN